MAIDSREAPTLASCDQDGCTASFPNTTGDPLPAFEHVLVVAGWTWFVDYETVHSCCPLHPPAPELVNQ